MKRDGNTLVLTDDEALAIASSQQLPWPTPLLTVDQSDDESSAIAIVRGIRSLAVRELLSDGGLNGARLAQALAMIEGRLVIRTYLSADGDSFASGGSVSSFALTADGRVAVELESAAGIHVLSIISHTAAAGMIVTAAESVSEIGVPGNPGLSLCVLVSGFGTFIMQQAHVQVRGEPWQGTPASSEASSLDMLRQAVTSSLSAAALSD